MQSARFPLCLFVAIRTKPKIPDNTSMWQTQTVLGFVLSVHVERTI